MFKMQESKPLWEGIQKPGQTHPKDDNRWRAVHKNCQNNDDAEVATEDFDMARSKVYKFYCVKLVFIAKL